MSNAVLDHTDLIIPIHQPQVEVSAAARFSPAVVVEDVLSADQIAHKNDRDRFHRNANAVKNAIRHEVQVVKAHFRVKDGVISLDPVDIGYLSDWSNLKHLPIERRTPVSLAECRYENVDYRKTQNNVGVLHLPLFVALERIAKDGYLLEQYDVSNGAGLLLINFINGKIHVRVMADNYSPSDKNPYPFLIVE